MTAPQHRHAEPDIDLTDRAVQGAPGAPDEADERSLTEVVSSLSTDLTELLRTQVELAKVELKEEATTAAKAGAMGGAAAVVGLCTLLLVGFTVAWALDEIMPTWAGFLIVTVIYAAVAAALALMARTRISQLSLAPPETTQTLQEDAEWLRQHTN